MKWRLTTHGLPRWWREHFLGSELGFGLLMTTAITVLVRWLGWIPVVDHVLDQNRGAVYGALASIFGALLGFVITSISIVLGFSNDNRFERIRVSSSYFHLWLIFTSSVRWLGAATAAAVFALLADRDGQGILARGLEVGCLLTSVMATLRLARAVWALEGLIDIAVHQDPLRGKQQE